MQESAKGAVDDEHVARSSSARRRGFKSDGERDYLLCGLWRATGPSYSLSATSSFKVLLGGRRIIMAQWTPRNTFSVTLP